MLYLNVHKFCLSRPCAQLFLSERNIMGVMLLVQGRGEMAVLPTVTAVLLHHSAMDTWTEGNVVSTR